MFRYDNLMNYYKTNFNLQKFHHYSLTELDNMVPWEKHLYIDMIKQYVKEQNEKARDAASLIRRQGK